MGPLNCTRGEIILGPIPENQYTSKCSTTNQPYFKSHICINICINIFPAAALLSTFGATKIEPVCGELNDRSYAR